MVSEQINSNHQTSAMSTGSSATTDLATILPTTPVNKIMLPSSSSSLISINVSVQAPLKLTSTYYLSWKLQFQTLFTGYDLLGFVDDTTPCPLAVLPTTTGSTPNPAHHLWVRQDQLIHNAVVGSLSPTIIPFVARATTSQEAWTILATTYTKPSRGRIKQVKATFKNKTKGIMFIIDFLQTIKSRADELAILSAPMDPDDLIEKILDELGDDYNELVRAVQTRDTAISFDELHEKIITFESTLSNKTPAPSLFPATVNIT